MLPGMTNTSRPWSAANVAVISAPLRAGASMISVPSVMPGDDPVPGRKILGVRFCAWRELGEDGSGLQDLFGKPPVLGWIDHVWSGAEHRDRSAARFERGAMGGRIHPARQSRDDSDASLGELRRDSLGGLPSIRRRPARTDDGD